MRISKIKAVDIANGQGCRTSLFVSGCRRHCPGCFNEQTWDFSNGFDFTQQVQDRVIDSLRPGWVDGLTLLGGEPMEPENQQALLPFLQRVRSELPDKSIWCYTGFTLEQLVQTDCLLLPYIDVLVDGPFISDQKDITLRFRGSRNQRVIDLKRWRRNGDVTAWCGI